MRLNNLNHYILLILTASLILGTHLDFSQAAQAQGGGEVREKAAAKPTRRAWRVHLYGYPLTQVLRSEVDQDQENKAVTPQVFGLGFRYRNWGTDLEYSQYRNSTESGNIEVARSQKEFSAWLRYRFFKRKRFSSDFALGAGVYDEKISTRVAESSLEELSRNKWLAGAGLGAQYVFHPNILTAVEARSLGGKDLDPQPQWLGVLKIGFIF